MRLLLVNQYFWPDRAATAQLLANLAEDAEAMGRAARRLFEEKYERRSATRRWIELLSSLA